MIRQYCKDDEESLYSLWNRAGADMGYAPLSREKFRALLTLHPSFRREHTFVLETGGAVRGFVNGCLDPRTDGRGKRGFVSCLILDAPEDTPARTAELLTALENSFREAGCRYSAVSFFNPIRLPWVIPGTAGCQHNNTPGVAVDLPLYKRMLALGYREFTREAAMFLDLKDYKTPAWMEEKAARMAQEGYTVARYDPAAHTGLEGMVASLGNPQWSEEIPAAGKAGLNLLVGLCGNICAGFTGPIYPEDTGRGYFAGIGVAPHYEKHGLGTLLFYRLLEAEKAAGSRYMSLFTGVENPARKIYLGAGFRIVRTFSVMLKEL